MNVTINIVELASELAQSDIELLYDFGLIYDTKEQPLLVYSEEGQKIFNELYDKYYTIIESCKQ